MNKCMLIGNLTRDPELRTTNSSVNTATRSKKIRKVMFTQIT